MKFPAGVFGEREKERVCVCEREREGRRRGARVSEEKSSKSLKDLECGQRALEISTLVLDVRVSIWSTLATLVSRSYDEIKRKQKKEEGRKRDGERKGSCEES